jgi:hypothetical protein
VFDLARVEKKFLPAAVVGEKKEPKPFSGFGFLRVEKFG